MGNQHLPALRSIFSGLAGVPQYIFGSSVARLLDTPSFSLMAKKEKRDAVSNAEEHASPGGHRHGSETAAIVPNISVSGAFVDYIRVQHLSNTRFGCGIANVKSRRLVLSRKLERTPQKHSTSISNQPGDKMMVLSARNKRRKHRARADLRGREAKIILC